MTTSIRGWMAEGIPRLESGVETFRSMHLDDLGLAWGTWSEAIASLDLALAELPHAWPGRVSLALPLRGSSTLQTAPPMDPESAASEHEPPSIYLFAPSHFMVFLADEEEYRVRIELADVRRELPVEFVCSRDATGAARGWDYVNTVWIHHLATRKSP